MLRLALETRCANNNRVKNLISGSLQNPAADSDVLPSDTTQMRTSSSRVQALTLGTDITGGQIPASITRFSFYILEMMPAGV